jgi:hypothetical protein
LRDSLTDILVVVIAVIGFVALVRVGKDDDPAWEERWRALSPAERTRIAAAARSGALIAGGLAADSIILLVFGVLFLFGGIWATRYSYRVARAEREAIAREHSF